MKAKTLRILRRIFSFSIIEPLALILLYAGFLYMVDGVMPDSERLIQHLESLYLRYGYEILFLGALLESLVIINLAAPGMVALAFGGVFAKTGQLDLPLVILAAVLGALTGYIIDFFLGYFGFSKVIGKVAGMDALGKVKKQVNKSDVRLFSLGFFHPNLGSIISLAAGTVEMRFVSFLSLAAISTLVWFCIWGILVYVMGDIVLVILTKYLSMLTVVFATVWLGLFLYGRRKKSTESSVISHQSSEIAEKSES